jgi:hypothetical protein
MCAPHDFYGVYNINRKFTAGADGKCIICAKTRTNHHETEKGFTYCDVKYYWACCNCAFDIDPQRSHYDTHGCGHCKARRGRNRAGAQQVRPVTVAGSDGETEAVRLLENATAEAVCIRRYAEEYARKIMQDARVQADLILNAARTDAQGVAAQAAQDSERARRDRELAAQDLAEARTEAAVLSRVPQNDTRDIMELLEDLNTRSLAGRSLVWLQKCKASASKFVDRLTAAAGSIRGAVPDALRCPITQDVMVDPVMVTETGHTYERSAIEQWLRTRNTDPTTNVQLTSKTLIPNHSLRSTIEGFLENNVGAEISPSSLFGSVRFLLDFLLVLHLLGFFYFCFSKQFEK